MKRIIIILLVFIMTLLSGCAHNPKNISNNLNGELTINGIKFHIVSNDNKFTISGEPTKPISIKHFGDSLLISQQGLQHISKSTNSYNSCVIFQLDKLICALNNSKQVRFKPKLKDRLYFAGKVNNTNCTCVISKSGEILKLEIPANRISYNKSP